MNNALDKTDLADRLNRQLDWIKSCDTKASIVLAVVGIFLTIFTSSHSLNTVNQIFSDIIRGMNFSNLLYLVFFVGSWLLFAYGAFCLIRVLIPRLKANVIRDDDLYGDSLYYFEDISKNKFLDFKQKMSTITPEDEINDLLSQIYINAQICTIKYSYYKRGIKWTFISMALLLVLYIMGVILLKSGGF